MSSNTNNEIQDFTKCLSKSRFPKEKILSLR